MNLEDELAEIFNELLDEHFPKGYCSERGEALVLVALATIKIKELFKEQNSTGIEKDPKFYGPNAIMDWSPRVDFGS